MPLPRLPMEPAAEQGGLSKELGSTLVTSIETLRPLLDLSPLVTGIVELLPDDFQVLYINAACRAVVGMNPEQLVGRRARGAGTPAEAVDLWVHNLQKCLASAAPTSFDYKRPHASSHQHQRVYLSYLCKSSEGHPLFSYVMQDVSDLEESKSALRGNQERLQLTQEFADMGSWEWDPRSGVLQFSSSLRRLYGFAADHQLSVAEFVSRVHEEDRQPMQENIEACRMHGIPHHMEFRIIRPDGDVAWIEGRGKAVFDEAGECIHILGIAMNITRRKMAELLSEKNSNHIVQLSKMSALGEMAGGVAHEINNPLTVIRASASLLKRQLKSGQLDPEKLGKIAADTEATCERIAKIIEGLRFFARDGSEDSMELVPVKSIVEETLAFCQERFKTHGVQLRVDAGSGREIVQCRPVQISQVLLNLLNNAHDALQGRAQGAVTELRVSMQGPVTCIEVSDNGPGVPKQDVDRIFQPFFSRKAKGLGTGLGLSIAKGIAEAHGGSLRYSRVDGRSSFALFLPPIQTEAGLPGEAK